MKRLGAPIASPDGKWVVFTVTEPAYDEKDQKADLWIVPTDGSAKPRRLTATRTGESNPAWAPDSRRIAFDARRDGDEVRQVYVLDLAGGEAERITNLSTGAGRPKFSPDGQSILFTSNVYPGAVTEEDNKRLAAERKARKYRARVYETFPIRNWDRWLDDLQPHIFVQPPAADAKPRDLLAGTQLAQAKGFGGLTSDEGDNLNAVWAPDGRSIVFNASTNKHEAAFRTVVMRLYQAPLSGGEPKPLTTDEASGTKPVFRPDGKALYFTRELRDNNSYHLDRLAMMPWPAGGETRLLSPSFDRSVSSYGFSPDGRSVYLTAEDAGHEKVYTIAASGGETRLLFEMDSGVYTNLSLPGKTARTMLIAGFESAVNPPEIVRIDPETRKHELLSDFNTARAAGIDWQPLRSFWFTSKGGRRIHNLMALPPDFDEKKKYPLFVFMHGGPHTMARDQFVFRWNYHLLARPGYVVLMTDYTGSTGYGETFARQIQGDPLRTPGEEINQAVDEAIAKYPFIDGARVAAGGASYGGHLANWMQATTTRFKCLISHAGLINLESQWGTSDGIYHREINNGGPVWEQGKVWREQNPIRYAKNFRTPILLTVGENDFRVPLNQTLENWSVLQRLKIPSKLLVFPDENHWILKGENSRFFYAQVHEWLARWLGTP